MKIKCIGRSAEKKSNAKKLRREGLIPAILYTAGKEGEAIAVDKAEFAQHLRSIEKGHLPTTIFTLADEHGKEKQAIIKEIQYHPTSYEVLHLDFEGLHKDQLVNIRVPIEFTGAAECPGIKLGGVLRAVIRHIKVRCLPKDIPESFKLSVASLSMKESMRLRDLEIPQSVRPLADLNEVVVVIAKR